LDSSNFNSSKIRIAVLAGLVISLLYLTGCCDQQQQGQAADGGRKPTEGIVKKDKPQGLEAQPAGNNGATGPAVGDATTDGDEQTQTGDNTESPVVNNLDTADPRGAGLTAGDDSKDGDNAQDKTPRGEQIPTLDKDEVDNDEPEKASQIDTDDLK
tara:strand:- start:1820 stop:2287 length:468 start_codon:yes stop_codon:yes gene_type:complete